AVVGARRQVGCLHAVTDWVEMAMRLRAGHLDRDLGRLDGAAARPSHAHAHARESEPGGQRDELGRRPAGVDQGAQEHVAARAREAVEVGDDHAPFLRLARARRERVPARVASALTRWAAKAAPNPLSMFTTATPGAHELSMPRRAARPRNEAP